jgi:hypothetical protein
MIEFKNNKNYFAHILIVTVIITVAISLLYFWKGGSISPYIFFLLFLEFILISKNFTKTILIRDGFLIIYYYKWMQKRCLKLQEHDIKTKFSTIVSNRSGSNYKRLELFVNNKVVYKISSNDGFDEEDLKEIENKIK